MANGEKRDSRPGAGIGWVILLVVVVAVLIGWLVYGSAEPAGACVVGNCPTELRQNDSGGAYTYAPASRFTVVLDSRSSPKASLVCTPPDVIGQVATAPAVTAPLYAVTFEAMKPGKCSLSSGDFTADIIVTAR